MTKMGNAYELETDKSADGLKFFFISKGELDVIKVIQFSFVQQLNGKNVYNLGFGDYDLENDTIVDNVNTNNGDAYKVFNTVLSTIPVFFENYGDGILMVQGSDGRPEFVESCKLACKKKCADECRNYNRRINVYRGYIDKNYEILIVDYQFLGAILDKEQQIILGPYERHKKYDSVFLLKKNV
jgi:hypothetical protein